MKKIITTLFIAALLCAIVCTSAFAWHGERCPFCGEDEAFLRYGEDYGVCTKCGQDTRRFDLTVNIRSCGSEDEIIEASLYQYGKQIRLNQVQGTDTFASFISVQHGVYTLVVTKEGHTAYSQTVWLTGDTVLDVNLSPVFCRPTYFMPFGWGQGARLWPCVLPVMPFSEFNQKGIITKAQYREIKALPQKGQETA